MMEKLEVEITRVDRSCLISRREIDVDDAKSCAIKVTFSSSIVDHCYLVSIGDVDHEFDIFFALEAAIKSIYSEF